MIEDSAKLKMARGYLTKARQELQALDNEDTYRELEEMVETIADFRTDLEYYIGESMRDEAV